MITIYVYLGILGAGIIGIAVILLKESKGQKTSAVELLNSLEVDEAPEELTKPTSKSSSSFLNRLSMENNNPKENSGAADPLRDEIEKAAEEFERKLKNTNTASEKLTTEESKPFDENT